MLPSRSHRLIIVLLLVGAVFLSGCGLIFGSTEPEPTATPVRALVPTFTPTPEGQAPAADAPAVADAPADAPLPTETPIPEPVPTDTPIPEPTPTETPPPAAIAVVAQDIVNVRQGPGTNYGLVGSVSQGQELEITGKNEDGSWWQICCVNGEQAWIFAQLVTAQNAESVAVAQNIPAAPAAQPQPQPQPAAPQPEPPAPEPVEEAPPPAPANPDAGPCGGDDGCKFRVTGGPATGGNGGLELKMQFMFMHSGVEGGQPQGSYFVVLKKDGVRLPVPDSVRSIAKNKSSGQLGDFNYEFSLGTGDLPGNTVAGGYTVWVLDGNGERDSEPYNFNIDNPQNGLLWIQFDQG